MPLVASAITTSPATYSATPTSMMRSAPNLSASAPAKGWLAPHIRFCSASAKAKVSRFQPCACVIGRLNRPKPWRMPIESVTSRPPHTSTVVRESCRFCMSWLGVRLAARWRGAGMDCLCLLWTVPGRQSGLPWAGWWRVYPGRGKRVRHPPEAGGAAKSGGAAANAAHAPMAAASAFRWEYGCRHPLQCSARCPGACTVVRPRQPGHPLS
ncbi:hypothetical protein D9M70_546920 [compost metagenome]